MTTPFQVATMAELLAKGETADILFWVGCSGSFDDRAKKITKAVAKILHACNVKFAVLGAEESCTGDPAKRAGNEFTFQMQAMMNIQVLDGYEVKKIVTACPHCFNTLKNEYPELGGKYEVIHHTQLIQELINQGKLAIKLDAELVEMKRCKKNGLCCGAGGAQMFKEAENGNKEINIERTEDALETSASIIATGCPFCNTMMTDGVKNFNKEHDIQVLDVAELIANAADL